MVFGVADANVPMRESLKNLIRAVGLRVEVFISAQEVGRPGSGIWRGLRAMRERAAQIGAKLVIRTGRRLGTKIVVTVPISL